MNNELLQEYNTMKSSSIKHLYNHISQETAYVVTDYPWCFRLRTTIRYWIESKDTKNGGQRFVSQTINPKTGKWCEPKKSTYSPIIVMYLDENEHVKYSCLRYNSSKELINKFKETHLNYLDQFQLKNLKEIIAYENVMKNVTFTCELITSEESEEKRKQNEISLNNISKAIYLETNKVVL